MEVVVPRAPKSPEFHFSRSTAPSPYASAPSSPRPFGNPDEYYYCYTSAPASPSRATAVYSYFAGDMDDWEEKPLSPKSRGINEFDFALGAGAQEELSTADELFDNGRIRALKPPHPPRLDLPPISPRPSPRGLWSPRGGEERSSFTIERGRERAPLSPSRASSRSRRESRSLSPLREEASHRTPVTSPPTSTSASASAAAPSVKSSGSKKWRLKDLLLFRSASEGRATGRRSKDPLWKYTMLSVSFNKRRPSEDAKSSGSFRSMDSSSSMKRGSSGPAVSAHELHYTANRAASEEQKKKTPLPYHRNTLFGCLHFNPAVRSITRGFNSNSFNRCRP